MECTRWRTDTEQSGRRELRIRRHNKQLFTNKAALGTVRQIIDNRLVRFGNISFNLVNFQGPDRVSGPFDPIFKFAGLIQIPHIDKRRQFFSFTPTGLEYFVDGFEATAFSLILKEGCLPVSLVTSLFSALTTSGSLLTHAVERWL